MAWLSSSTMSCSAASIISAAELLDLVRELLCGEMNRGAGIDGGAGRKRADPKRGRGGVSGHDGDIVGGDAEMVGGDLGERGLMRLATADGVAPVQTVSLPPGGETRAVAALIRA